MTLDNQTDIKRERIACFAYALFFFMPVLLIGLNKGQWFSWLLPVSLIFLLGGLFSPVKLSPINRVLGGVFERIHLIAGQVFLLVMFILMITPTSWLLRIIGKAPIQMFPAEKIQSYWVSRLDKREWKQFFDDPF